MLIGKRGTRATEWRRNRAFDLRPEVLEGRRLLAIDLVNTATAPYGVQEVGFQAGGGVGWSVTDVGNVNGSGYDSFVVSAPTVVRNGNGVSLGTGSNPAVYLILGSKSVTAGTIDFSTLTTQQRIGDLALLGNSTQTNPANGNAGFNFDGVTLTAGLSGQSTQLGASVVALGDLNGDGFSDFMIGAPGANDPNGGNAGTGKAYIVYGGPNFGVSSKTMDLDNPLTYQSNVITLVSNNPGAHLGFSGAAVGDVITDGLPDMAVGAPGATVNGLQNAGEVFLISGANVRTARTTTLNVDTVGQAGGLPGITFTGTGVGDQLGYSVAAAGNFDGARTSANQPVGDFVMGAPQLGTGGGGYAAMVYGGLNLTTFATTTGGFTSINVSRIGLSTTLGNVPGIFFNGSAGDQTGYALSYAGDFNNDGLGDFMIGSPNSHNGNGGVDLIEGVPFASRFTGTVLLSAIPSTLPSVTFVGAQQGSLAGYSMTQVGKINNDPVNEIAIGSPGFNNGSGAVYLMPGNPDLSGTYSLAAAEAQPLAGTLITVSGSVGGAFLGASVSGRLTQLGQTRTLDADLIGDLIIGAPGYSLPNAGSNPPTTSRNTAGAVFALEGRFIPLAIPVSTSISTTIGVGTAKAPFSIDANNPAALDIYVYSNAAANFHPVTDINPTTIVVNGVSYVGATIRADPIDENGDGIPDAIITITPRSNLGLTNGTVTFTISGRTKTSAGNRRFTGTTAVTVTGAGGGTGGGGTGGSGFVGSAAPVGAQQITTLNLPLGERLIPSLGSLSHLDSYQPLPLSVGLNQFLPSPAYIARASTYDGKPSHSKHGRPDPHALIVRFGHQKSGLGYRVPRDPITSGHYGTGRGGETLGSHIFNRGVYHAGKTIRVNHKVVVIPLDRQRNLYR